MEEPAEPRTKSTQSISIFTDINPYFFTEPVQLGQCFASTPTELTNHDTAPDLKIAMLARKFLLGLPALVLFYAFDNTLPVSAQALPTCDPIGRISDGSSQNYRRGQVVCSGSEIREPSNVQFLCFLNGIVVPLTGESITVTADTCRVERTSGIPTTATCDRTGLGSVLCLISKGPEEQFQVITPNAISSNPRPTISWESVEDAESYTVNVIGPDMSWQTSVGAEQTELIYPEEERALAADNAYEVLVVANRSQEPLIASKVINIRTLTRLSPSSAEQGGDSRVNVLSLADDN